MPKFRNPANGHTVFVDNVEAVWRLLWPPFCIGEIGHGLYNSNWPSPLDGLLGLLT